MIKPKRSPRSNISPAFDRHTMRLATAPAICTTPQLRSAFVDQMQRVLLVDARGVFLKGREKFAGLIAHVVNPAGHRRAIDMDVEGRQKDADTRHRVGEQAIAHEPARW